MSQESSSALNPVLELFNNSVPFNIHKRVQRTERMRTKKRKREEVSKNEKRKRARLNDRVDGVALSDEQLTDLLNGLNTPDLLDSAELSKRHKRLAQPIIERRMEGGLYRKENLTDEQMIIFDAVLNGESIYFGGKAGAGKSVLLKTIINELRLNEHIDDSKIKICSPTGIAAYNVKGCTIHNLLGLGCRPYRNGPAMANTILKNKTLKRIWQTMELLVVDEVSMFDGMFFQHIEHAMRIVRGNTQPFGGIQLVLCGDFFQLPPVASKGSFAPARFIFEVEAWYACVQRCFELTRIVRQSDSEFICVLNCIREGNIPKNIVRYLQTLDIGDDVEKELSIDGPHLFAKNDKVRARNATFLSKLEGELGVFESIDACSASEPRRSELLSELDDTCPYISELHVKNGAKVMLRRNLSVARGLVNGAVGTVESFSCSGEHYVDVRFAHAPDELIRIKPHTWRKPDPASGGFTEREQIPITLAYAYSIHKCQGLTFKSDILIDMTDIFCSGQAYVAFSRVQHSSQIHVKNFNPGKIRARKKVLSFNQNMRSWIRPGLDNETLHIIYPAGWNIGDIMVASGQRPARIPLTSILERAAVVLENTNE